MCIRDSFGTATTFDAVSAEGDYLGGAIAPGLAIAADALGQRAAQLFRVELTAPPDVIGKSTVQAMQSGLFLGYVALVEGLVNRFRVRLGPVSYTHLRAHETVLDLVCRLLLEQKKQKQKKKKHTNTPTKTNFR